MDDTNSYIPHVELDNLNTAPNPYGGPGGGFGAGTPSQMDGTSAAPQPTQYGPAPPSAMPTPPQHTAGYIQPGYTVGRGGRLNKPPIQQPIIKAPRFEEYVVQQLLSDENGHNTTANLKDSDIYSYVKPYMEDILGTATSQGITLDADKKKAMIADFKNDVYNFLPQVRNRIAAEEAKFKSRTSAPPASSGFFGNMLQGAKNAVADLGATADKANLIYQMYGPGKTDMESASKSIASQKEIEAYQQKHGTPSFHDVMNDRASWTDWAGGVIGEVIPFLALGGGVGKVAKGLTTKAVTMLGSTAADSLAGKAAKIAADKVLAEGGTAAAAELAGKQAVKDFVSSTVGKTAATVGEVGTFGAQGAISSAGQTVTAGMEKGETPSGIDVLKSATGGFAQGALPLAVEAKGIKRAFGGGPGGYTGNILTRTGKSAAAAATANVAGTAAGRLGRGEDLASPEALQAYEEAGAAGSILGVPGGLRAGEKAPEKATGTATAGAEGGAGAAGAGGGGAAAGGFTVTPSIHLNLEAQAVFKEVFDKSAAAPDTSPAMADVALDSALKELNERLDADGVSKADRDKAKADFTTQWRERHAGGTQAAPGVAPESTAPKVVDNSALIDKLNIEREKQVRLQNGNPDYAHEAELRIKAIDDKILELKTEQQTSQIEAEAAAKKTAPVTPPGGPPTETGQPVRSDATIAADKMLAGMPGGIGDTGITKEMLAQLKELGWDDAQIFKEMSLDEAKDHIANGTGPEAEIGGAVTQEMKDELKSLGYKDAFIDNLSLKQAQDVIDAGRKRTAGATGKEAQLAELKAKLAAHTKEIHDKFGTKTTTLAMDDYARQIKQLETEIATGTTGAVETPVETGETKPVEQPPAATNVLKAQPAPRSAESIQRSIDTFKKLLASEQASHVQYSKSEGSKQHLPRVERNISDLKETIARLEKELTGAKSEPEPLTRAETLKATKPGPKYSDHEIVTAPHMDVRYPLGILRAALTRAREIYKTQDPVKEQIERQADELIRLHEVDPKDTREVEALGELLEDKPDSSPSKNDIRTKAGEYLDPAKKRTVRHVFAERVAQRDKHPKIRLQNVLLREADAAKRDSIAEEAKKRIAAEKEREAAEQEAYKKRQDEYDRQHPRIEAEETAQAEDEETNYQRRQAEYKEALKVVDKADKAAADAQAAADKAQKEADKLKKTKPLQKKTLAEKKKEDAAKAAADEAKKEAARQKEKANAAKRDAERKKVPPKNELKKQPPAPKKTIPKKGEAGAAAKNKSAKPKLDLALLEDRGPGHPKSGELGVRSDLISQPTTAANKLSKMFKEYIEATKPGKNSNVKFEEIRTNSLSPELRDVVNRWKEAVGHSIRVFKNLTPHISKVEGMADSDGNIWISSTASHPATAIAAHEFIHHLAKENPALYKELVRELHRQNARIVDYAEHLRENQGYGDIKTEKAIEEMVANLTGDAFTDEAFLNKLAQRNPTVFGRIVSAFLKFVRSLVGGKGHLGAKDYLNDVEAFNNKLLDVLAKYQPKRASLLQKLHERLTGKTDLSFSRPTITTAEEAKEAAKEWEKRPPSLIATGKALLNRGPDSLKPTAVQKFLQYASNTIEPLKNYNEHLERLGIKVTTDKNGYMAFTVLRGRQKHEIDTDGANYIAPIMDALRTASKKHGMSEGQYMAMFSQWIRGKDALKTNDKYELENIKLTPEADAKRIPLKLAMRRGTFTGNYLHALKAIVDAPGAKLEQHVDPITGMNNVEAYKAIKGVNKAGFSDAMGEDFNKAFHKLRRRITENQLRSGSFSEADVRQQRAQDNPYYMPKSDWADEDIRVPQKVFGSPLGAFDRMAYAGRETPIDDPVQAIFNKLLFSSKDAADNEATKVLLNMAQDPNQKLNATVHSFDMDNIAEDAIKGGKLLGEMKKVAAGPRSIIHNEGNKRYVITLPEDSQQLRAIKESQNPVSLEGLHKGIGKVTGAYGRVHTAMSPSFAMVNAAIRDALYIPAMMALQGKSELIPGYIGNYMKYGGPMGAWAAYLKWDRVLPEAATIGDMEKYALANPNSFAGKLYRLEKAGGGFNFRDEFSNAKKLEKLRDEMHRQEPGTINSIKRGLKNIVAFQDAVATGSMMAGRVAAFESALAKGMSDKEAAFYSKRLLDYQQTSEGSRILNSWFAFSRVGITSLDALMSALKNEKGQIEPKRAAMGMMLMGVGTAGAYAAVKAIMGDDKAKKLSDDALAKNVVLPNPWDENTPFQLPIGLGMPRLAWGISMLATRLAEGDTTAASAGRTLKNLLLENVSPLHPIESKEGADSGTIAADLAGALVPSIARPGYESFLNQTAFGSQIHEAPQYTQGYASEAGRLTTGDMYKTWARGLRSSIGLDVYPETLRHLLSSYDPGVLNLLFKNVEKEEIREAGLDVDESQATVFSAIFNHDLKFAAGKEYYQSKLGLEDAKKEAELLKSQDKDVPDSIQEKVDLDKEFIKASREHSKAVKAITSNALLAGSIKTSRLAAVQRDWSKIQEDFSKQAARLEH